MSDPEKPSDEVLGRLPRTRLGRRSPLRDEAPRKPTPAAKQAPEPAPAPEPPDPTGLLAGAAKTGAGVAVGAAGLGLRAAGGMLRALRGGSERR